jgi:hypothetical protein
VGKTYRRGYTLPSVPADEIGFVTAASGRSNVPFVFSSRGSTRSPARPWFTELTGLEGPSVGVQDIELIV